MTETNLSSLKKKWMENHNLIVRFFLIKKGEYVARIQNEITVLKCTMPEDIRLYAIFILVKFYLLLNSISFFFLLLPSNSRHVFQVPCHRPIQKLAFHLKQEQQQ